MRGVLAIPSRDVMLRGASAEGRAVVRGSAGPRRSVNAPAEELVAIYRNIVGAMEVIAEFHA